MSTRPPGEPREISDKVARGFEALVESEQRSGGLRAARPSSAARRQGAAVAAPTAGQDGSADLGRLTEEIEGIRAELQAALAQATADLAEERQELRTQIAKTVGAANKWFVKARDQLMDRLDQLEAATTAAAAAKAGLGAKPAAKPAKAGGLEDSVMEWDVEDEGGGGPRAKVELNVDAPELEALMDPVRGDIQELQGEVSAMGEAVAELRGELAALAKRLPARPRPVRLDERDIAVIVEAVLTAQAAEAPKRAPAKRSRNA